PPSLERVSSSEYLRPHAVDYLAVRLRAALRFACVEIALREPAPCPSRFRALRVARPRLGEGDRRARMPRPSSYASSAERPVRPEVRPFTGGFRGTPARRALDRPIAIACLVERAPCFPWRM